jgi:hypothetical protein
MGRGAGGELGALGMPNPYSRAEALAPGATSSCSFVHREAVPPSAPGCATMLRRRRSAASSLRYSFSGASLACGRGGPIEQPQAACPPRRRMLPWPPCGLPRTGAELAGSSGTCARASSTATTATMPARVPQGVYSRSSARYELARAAALGNLRQARTLQSMMLLGSVTCAGWRCVTFDGAANGCFRTKSDCRRRNSIG